MKFEVIITIAILWFIYRAVMKARKKNQANLQAGGQISNNSANTTQNFVDQAAFQEQLRVAVHESEGRSLEQIVEEATPRIADPFLEARSLEDNDVAKNRRSLEDNAGSHYNEENLVQQYEQTHSEGKALAHHKHQLFEDQKDRQKASRHVSYAGKPASARTHASGHSPAPKVSGRAQRRVKPLHPIAAALKGKTNLKQAFVLAEVLKRIEE